MELELNKLGECIMRAGLTHSAASSFIWFKVCLAVWFFFFFQETQLFNSFPWANSRGNGQNARVNTEKL